MKQKIDKDKLRDYLISTGFQFNEGSNYGTRSVVVDDLDQITITARINVLTAMISISKVVTHQYYKMTLERVVIHYRSLSELKKLFEHFGLPFKYTEEIYYLHISYKAFLQDKSTLQGDALISSSKDIISLRNDVKKNLEKSTKQVIENLILTSLSEVSKDTFELLGKCGKDD